jgi:tetratricopeptide (TPR) repeat protein
LATGIVTFFTLTAQAENSGFDCAAAMAGTAEQQQQVAAELLNASYDTTKLACAANAISAFADGRDSDYAARLLALQANARYMYYLDRIIVFELGYLIDWYVVEVPKEKKLNEPMIAMIAARERQLRTLQQARAAGFDTAELKFFESLIIGPNAEALPLLQAAVAEDPQSLHGAAHALMAETYYALPDIAGGDLDLAIDMMRAALQRDPDNPLYARLLAGYLLDTAQDGEARSILNQILQMQADAGGLQLRADQLQAASDLATRVGDAVLAQQLSAQREEMYEDYPYLQKRSVVSAMGHFGDKDPMEDPG